MAQRRRPTTIFIQGCIIIIISAILLSGGCNKKSSNTYYPPPVPKSQRLFDRINTERENNSAPTLQYSTELESVAQTYVDLLESMAAQSYSDNADGLTVEQRLDAAGIVYVAAGQAGFLIDNDGTADTALSELSLNFNSMLFDVNFISAGIATANWQ